ncbi:hypothetical protein GGS26DRAFT_339039 [Hypomontagnella submonticulosa]|nr:hypothetical protein GGS26DRAFT_339039 [Hypomontagnella submonticulosa]
MASQEMYEWEGEHAAPVTKEGLRRLKVVREEYKRLQTALAICQHDLARLKRDRDNWRDKEWVSRHTRKRERIRREKERRRIQELKGRQGKDAGQPIPLSPTSSDIEAEIQSKPREIEKQIRTAQKHVRRASVQLLVAAAAGKQYCEADRQGPIIQGILPGTVRKNRAFDARRTASVSSTEAVARRVNRWINRESDRATRPSGEGGDSEDDEVSLDTHTSDSDSEENDEIIGTAMAMMTDVERVMEEGVSESGADNGDGVEDLEDEEKQDDSGSSVDDIGDDEIAMDLLNYHINRKEIGGYNGPSSGSGNQPALPNKNIYNPNRWLRIINTGESAWIKEDGFAGIFKNPQDLTETGWMTWEEQEKTYPQLDSLLIQKEVNKRDEPYWDPDLRELRETKMREHEREPLEANVATMVSIERRAGQERAEMDNLYEEYPRVPSALPNKLTDQEMRAGPLPPPPMLPMVGPSGREIEETEAYNAGPRVRTYPPNTFTNRRGYEKLPKPTIDYSAALKPGPSTYRFKDGSSVADIFKPGDMDEPDQVRGSKELIEYGKKVEAAELPFRKPYTYEGMPQTLPASAFPPYEVTDEDRRRARRPQTKEEQDKELNDMWKRLVEKRKAEKANAEKARAFAKDKKERRAALAATLAKQTGDQKKPPETAPAVDRPRPRGYEPYLGRILPLSHGPPLRDPKSTPFWHYKDIGDKTSKLLKRKEGTDEDVYIFYESSDGDDGDGDDGGVGGDGGDGTAPSGPSVPVTPGPAQGQTPKTPKPSLQGGTPGLPTPPPSQPATATPIQPPVLPPGLAPASAQLPTPATPVTPGSVEGPTSSSEVVDTGDSTLDALLRQREQIRQRLLGLERTQKSLEDKQDDSNVGWHREHNRVTKLYTNTLGQLLGIEGRIHEHQEKKAREAGTEPPPKKVRFDLPTV